MNKNIAFAALVVLFTAGGSARAQSMVKIGTVDMKEIFDSYYKTKEAELRTNERRNQSKNELGEREVAYQKIVTEIKTIREEINNPALGNDTKARKKQELDNKLAEREIKEREINDFRRTREKQLQEESASMRAAIVDDINKVVAEKVKAGNYDVVLDKSGMSIHGGAIVMVGKVGFDFTDSVVSTLNNKNRGTESEAVAAATNKASAEMRQDGHEATEREEDFAAAPVKPNRNISRSGPNWIHYGEGILKAAKHATLIRQTRDAQKNVVRKVYVVNDAEGIVLLQKWLRRSIAPLLDTLQKDSSPLWRNPPWALFVYASSDEEVGSLLVSLPLNEIFDNFSEKDFQALVETWKAKEE